MPRTISAQRRVPGKDIRTATQSALLSKQREEQAAEKEKLLREQAKQQELMRLAEEEARMRDYERQVSIISAENEQLRRESAIKTYESQLRSLGMTEPGIQRTFEIWSGKNIGGGDYELFLRQKISEVAGLRALSAEVPMAPEFIKKREIQFGLRTRKGELPVIAYSEAAQQKIFAEEQKKVAAQLVGKKEVDVGALAKRYAKDVAAFNVSASRKITPAKYELLFRESQRLKAVESELKKGYATLGFSIVEGEAKPMPVAPKEITVARGLTAGLPKLKPTISDIKVRLGPPPLPDVFGREKVIKTRIALGFTPVPEIKAPEKKEIVDFVVAEITLGKKPAAVPSKGLVEDTVKFIIDARDETIAAVKSSYQLFGTPRKRISEAITAPILEKPRKLLYAGGGFGLGLVSFFTTPVLKAGRAVTEPFLGAAERIVIPGKEIKEVDFSKTVAKLKDIQPAWSKKPGALVRQIGSVVFTPREREVMGQFVQELPRIERKELLELPVDIALIAGPTVVGVAKKLSLKAIKAMPLKIKATSVSKISPQLEGITEELLPFFSQTKTEVEAAGLLFKKKATVLDIEAGAVRRLDVDKLTGFEKFALERVRPEISIYKGLALAAPKEYELFALKPSYVKLMQAEPFSVRAAGISKVVTPRFLRKPMVTFEEFARESVVFPERVAEEVVGIVKPRSAMFGGEKFKFTLTAEELRILSLQKKYIGERPAGLATPEQLARVQLETGAKFKGADITASEIVSGVKGGFFESEKMILGKFVSASKGNIRKLENYMAEIESKGTSYVLGVGDLKKPSVPTPLLKQLTGEFKFIETGFSKVGYSSIDEALADLLRVKEGKPFEQAVAKLKPKKALIKPAAKKAFMEPKVKIKPTSISPEIKISKTGTVTKTKAKPVELISQMTKEEEFKLLAGESKRASRRAEELAASYAEEYSAMQQAMVRDLFTGAQQAAGLYSGLVFVSRIAAGQAPGYKSVSETMSQQLEQFKDVMKTESAASTANMVKLRDLTGYRSRMGEVPATATEAAYLSGYQPAYEPLTKIQAKVEPVVKIGRGAVAPVRIPSVPGLGPPKLLILPGGIRQIRRPLVIKKKKPRTGYDAYAKEKRKFIKLNKKPLAKNQALALGAKVVDNTASATFKVKPGKGKVKDTVLSAFKPNLVKFRSPRGKKNVFIEKNRNRIDTLGELQGITIKGWMKQRELKALGIPLRKSKRKRRSML